MINWLLKLLKNHLFLQALSLTAIFLSLGALIITEGDFVIFSFSLPIMVFLFSSVMLYILRKGKRFRLLKTGFGFIATTLSFIAVFFLVALVLGAGEMGKPRGGMIEAKSYKNSFSDFKKLGIDFPPNTKVLHASFDTVADDRGIDFIFLVDDQDINNLLPDTIKLQDIKTLPDFHFPNYFLCKESTDAQIRNNELRHVICTNEPNDKHILGYRVEGGLATQTNVTVIFYPDEKVLWLSYDRW